MKLQGSVGDQPVGAVAGFATSGKVDEAQEWRNNVDLPGSSDLRPPPPW